MFGHAWLADLTREVRQYEFVLKTYRPFLSFCHHQEHLESKPILQYYNAMPTPGILPAPSALSLSSPKQGKHQPKGKPLRHRQKSAPVQSFSRSGSSSPQPLLNCKSPKKGGGRQRPFPQPTEDSEDEYKSTTIPKQPGQASKRARPKGHRKKPSVVTPPPESQLPSENSTESLSRSLPSESFMSQQPGHSKSNNARRRIQEEADLWDTPAVSAIRSEAPTWQQSLFNGSDVPNNSANSSLKSRDDSLVGLKSGGVPAPPALTWQQELLQSSRPPSSAIRSLQPNHKAAATTAVSTGSPSKTRKQARRQSQPSSKPLTESDHASDSSGQAQELQGFSHLSLDETPSPAGSEVPSPSKPSKKKTPNKSKPRSEYVVTAI